MKHIAETIELVVKTMARLEITTLDEKNIELVNLMCRFYPGSTLN